MKRFFKDSGALEQKGQGPLGLDAAPLNHVTKTAIDKVQDNFSLYLRQERVLVPGTIANYLFFTKKFLVHRFRTGVINFSDLKAAEVVESVQHLASSLSRKRAKVMTSALRSFLRYARYQDFIRSDLAACVPCVADWSVASLPKGLSIEQVRHTRHRSSVCSPSPANALRARSSVSLCVKKSMLCSLLPIGAPGSGGAIMRLS